MKITRLQKKEKRHELTRFQGFYMACLWFYIESWSVSGCNFTSFPCEIWAKTRPPLRSQNPLVTRCKFAHFGGLYEFSMLTFQEVVFRVFCELCVRQDDILKLNWYVLG